jgi:hypothetical protein
MPFISYMSHFRGSARRCAALLAGLALVAVGTEGARAAATGASSRVALPQVQSVLPSGAADAGSLPASQTLPSIVIELKRTAAQQADLDSFLAAVQTSGSPDYRHWMTPAAFATRFSPGADVVAPVTAWLAAQGLTVQSTSAGGMRLVVSGTALQASTAFAIELHRLAMPSGDGVLLNGTPSIPAELASSIRAVSGLQTTPGVTDGLVALSAAVDTNTAAVVTADLKASGTFEELNDILEQASAQGQSVVALHADPAALPVRALSLVVAGGAAVTPSTANVTPRPDWQVAKGLPDDSLRATPDAAVATDATALVSALQGIVTKAGVRQGEVAATFYKLGPLASVFSHADGTAAGTWSAVDGLGTVDPDALGKVWPNGATPPLSATIALSSHTVTHGGSITLTATVTGGSGTPTGTITFSSAQGGTLGVSTLNASAVATYTTSTLAGGLYGFLGTYSGDSTYATTTTNVDTATIQPEAVTVAGSVPATAVGVGATIPVTVTVTAPSGVGTPSGIVTVFPFGTTIATQTFTGTLAASATTGTATALVNVPASNVGTFSFQTNCTTSASYSCYSPSAFSVTIAKGTPVITLTAAVGATDSNATLTAKVAAAVGTTVPTGTVQFMDGTTALGTPVTLVAGVATYTGALATASTASVRRGLVPAATVAHTLTAVFAGDANFATATSAAVTVNATTTLITTTTTLASSASSASYGSSLTLTVGVTPASTATSGAAPAGTVTITDSASGVVGTGTVASGAATITLTSLAVGAHSLTATYGGDTNYAASTSAATSVTVAAVTATAVATVTPTGSIPYGYNGTLSVTVTLPSAITASPGMVTAVISGNNGTYTGALGAATGSTTATAAIAFPVPPPGTYTITVTCNTNIVCASTTAKVTTVKGFTTTTLTVPTTAQAGIPVSVSATVANSGTGTGTYTYSGTVSFFSNGRLLGKGTLGAGGIATANVVLTSTAAQSITAVYSGDVNWSGSTSTASILTPTPSDATISLSANPTSGVVGQNVILTATVTASDSTNTLIPSGSVTFYNTVNGTVVTLGTATLLSNTLTASLATFSTTGLAAGTNAITAVYTGDTAFNKETSSALQVNIGDFTVSFVPSTLQLSQGSSGTVTALVSGINSFAGSVALGCTAPPSSLMTCSVTPSTVSVGGTAQIKITSTGATSARLSTDPGLPAGPRVLAGAGLGGLLALCLARGRRRRVAALLVLMLAVLLASGGCSLGQVDSTNNSNGGSGGAGGGTTVGGTPLGTYAFTITAASVNASVNVRHNYNLSVTVQ